MVIRMNVKISAKDKNEIKKLSEHGNVIENIANSFAPNIFGSEEVKESIVLQMFGSDRGGIHILLVGDPGTCAVELVKAAAEIHPNPNVVYHPDNAYTSMMPEGSLACICELGREENADAMRMLESLKHDKIKTSILAATAPTFGRFDPYLPISCQVNFHSYIIPLFDLKFGLRDVPDKSKDDEIAKRFLNSEKIEQEIENSLMKKYLCYARQHIHPKLNDDAKDRIREFFVGLRSKSSPEEGPIPLHFGQLVSLAKLAEAAARCRFDNVANKDDALVAIEMMKASLRQFGFDPEIGKIDIDRAEGRKK